MLPFGADCVRESWNSEMGVVEDDDSEVQNIIAIKYAEGKESASKGLGSRLTIKEPRSIKV